MQTPTSHSPSLAASGFNHLPLNLKAQHHRRYPHRSQSAPQLPARCVTLHRSLSASQRAKSGHSARRARSSVRRVGSRAVPPRFPAHFLKSPPRSSSSAAASTRQPRPLRSQPLVPQARPGPTPAPERARQGSVQPGVPPPAQPRSSPERPRFFFLPRSLS